MLGSIENAIPEEADKLQAQYVQQQQQIEQQIMQQQLGGVPFPTNNNNQQQVPEKRLTRTVTAQNRQQLGNQRAVSTHPATGTSPKYPHSTKKKKKKIAAVIDLMVRSTNFIIQRL